MAPCSHDRGGLAQPPVVIARRRSRRSNPVQAAGMRPAAACVRTGGKAIKRTQIFTECAQSFAGKTNGASRKTLRREAPMRIYSVKLCVHSVKLCVRLLTVVATCTDRGVKALTI